MVELTCTMQSKSNKIQRSNKITKVKEKEISKIVILHWSRKAENLLKLNSFFRLYTILKFVWYSGYKKLQQKQFESSKIQNYTFLTWIVILPLKRVSVKFVIFSYFMPKNSYR